MTIIYCMNGPTMMANDDVVTHGGLHLLYNWTHAHCAWLLLLLAAAAAAI